LAQVVTGIFCDCRFCTSNVPTDIDAAAATVATPELTDIDTRHTNAASDEMGTVRSGHSTIGTEDPERSDSSYSMYVPVHGNSNSATSQRYECGPYPINSHNSTPSQVGGTDLVARTAEIADTDPAARREVMRVHRFNMFTCCSAVIVMVISVGFAVGQFSDPSGPMRIEFDIPSSSPSPTAQSVTNASIVHHCVSDSVYIVARNSTTYACDQWMDCRMEQTWLMTTCVFVVLVAFGYAVYLFVFVTTRASVVAVNTSVSLLVGLHMLITVVAWTGVSFGQDHDSLGNSIHESPCHVFAGPLFAFLLAVSVGLVLPLSWTAWKLHPSHDDPMKNVYFKPLACTSRESC
jgi:hypothetical protein